MNKIELFQTALGFTTGIIFGEVTSHKCRNSFLNKSTREKVETATLAFLSGLSIYGELAFSKNHSPILFGASLGLNIASVSSAGRSENRFLALMNLATISVVFHHHFVKNSALAPEVIVPLTFALGTIFYARHKNIDALLDENDYLFDEHDDLIEENDGLLNENDGLYEENSVLAEQVEESREDAEALAREREEMAKLRAYRPFIDHHLSTGQASPRQLQEARDRFRAINDYQLTATPTRQRSLSRTRTAKMVANRKITKH